MKRITVILAAAVLAAILTSSLFSCGRRYEDGEIISAAKDLIARSEELNRIYFGDGIPLADEEDFAGPAPEPDGHFNLTHTGLFAADGNPLQLWKELSKMAASEPGFKEDLRIRLVGKVDREVLEAIADAGLEANVVALGPCDHATAVREQRSATVLLLPLRNDPQYAPILPGKLFEYLAARRPVLGIGQEDGAMARVLFSAHAGITAGWENPAPMRAFLATAWRRHCEGEVPAPCGDITAYSRRATAHALAQLLEKVSKA